jgi:hypothetical protein
MRGVSEEQSLHSLRHHVVPHVLSPVQENQDPVLDDNKESDANIKGYLLLDFGASAGLRVAAGKNVDSCRLYDWLHC